MRQMQCFPPRSLLWSSRQHREQKNVANGGLTVIVKSYSEPQDLVRASLETVMGSETQEEPGEKALGKKIRQTRGLDRKWCDRGG